jgi:hypothetical protein
MQWRRPQLVRLLLVVAVAAVSLPALLAPVGYLVTASACSSVAGAWCPWLSIALSLSAIAAWASFSVMGYAWSTAQRVATAWPLVGIISPLAACAPLYKWGVFIGYLVGPVLILQTFLIYHHLFRANHSSGAAAA